MKIVYKPEGVSVSFETNSTGVRQNENWKSKNRNFFNLIFKRQSEHLIFLVVESNPTLPSYSQLNTIIRQSHHLTAEHLCLIRACLLKQQQRQ